MIGPNLSRHCAVPWTGKTDVACAGWVACVLDRHDDGDTGDNPDGSRSGSPDGAEPTVHCREIAVLIGRLDFNPGAPCTLQLSPFGVRTWMIAIAVTVLLVVLLGVGVVSVARQRRATKRLLASASASAVDVDDRIAAAAERAGWALDRVSATTHPDVSAFCYGLIRPRVLVGTGFSSLLDDVER